MIMRRYCIITVMLAACLSASIGAQGTSRARVCRTNEKSPWFVKQRSWFEDSKHAWSNDSLRRRLLGSAGMSADSVTAVQLGFAFADESRLTGDSSMIASLLATAATRGSVWPTKSVVGGAGTRAVWLLALRDTALARATLKRMMEAGPDESNAADVASLEDRVRLASGRKQIYGTQLVRENGVARLAPLEDSAHVDLRREEAGLPPIALSLCIASGARR